MSINSNTEALERLLETANDLPSYDEVLSDGIEQGKQAEYDKFWDNYQGNGSRTSYSRAFYGPYWNDNIFNPKYDLVVTYATDMFNDAKITGHEKILNADFSQCTNFDRTFCGSTIKELGVIDLSSLVGSMSQTFHMAQAQKIAKLISRETTKFSSTAFQTTTLEDITFEGVIGQNITLTSPPLNKTSILSCVNVLSDTSTGMTVSFKRTAVDTAFETSQGAADGSTSPEWLALVATKPNWTITLA